jgi:hypothetical protein
MNLGNDDPDLGGVSGMGISKIGAGLSGRTGPDFIETPISTI